MNGPDYKDYYKILGVARTADEKEIKSAYRKLARKYHPDVNPGDKSAESRFKEISEAYDILSDSKKRSQYDSLGEQWKAYSRTGAPRGGGTRPGGFEFEFGGGSTPDLSELFATLFGGRKGAQANSARMPERGEDVEYGIDLTLEEAAAGASKALTLRIEDICPKCNGTGAARDSRGNIDLGSICPECRGVGRVGRTRKVDVKIPAGVKEGQRIRLAGEGAAGPGGKRGDLYLMVRLKPHPGFEREGSDLFTDVTIPYTVAALGGDIGVKTLNGERTLTVPPGVQSGQKIRITGQGMPAGGGKKPGDLYARVRVSVPKDLSQRERELLGELARIRGDKAQA